MQVIRRSDNNLTGWSPFDQLIAVRNELNRLMDNPWPELAPTNEFFNGWVPAMDVYEDKNNFVVRLEVPGMQKEKFEISLHEGALSISGERKNEVQSGPAQTYRSERFNGRFHRTVGLPKPLKSDQVTATYQDGILTVSLPKTEEAKPRQITVNAG